MLLCHITDFYERVHICVPDTFRSVSTVFRLVHIFLHDVGTLAFFYLDHVMSKAVQRIVGNVGCPWESLVPTGNGEAGNASLPNETAEQKIWRRRADWTIGQSSDDKNAHTHPHAIVL